jgi:hypothetical protein
VAISNTLAAIPSLRPADFPLLSAPCMKTKSMSEAQFLTLLQKVLPKAIKDPHLATTIYEEVHKEVQLQKSITAFEKFCEEGGIPDMEPNTVAELQNELVGRFGEDNVVVEPDEEGKGLEVEITLPDRTVSTTVKVDPSVAEEEVKVPFVPFPVALPEDPELVWVLGRQEDLGPDEAVRALALIEEEFWATKKGQELQRKGTEKNFAEFITHVPASALKDSGLKRHYKAPEVLKPLRRLTAAEAAELGAAV